MEYKHITIWMEIVETDCCWSKNVYTHSATEQKIYTCDTLNDLEASKNISMISVSSRAVLQVCAVDRILSILHHICFFFASSDGRL